MLKEGINILDYFSMNVCRMCICYKTNKCCPKIEKIWKDMVTEWEQGCATYSINCFRVSVKDHIESDIGENNEQLKEQLYGK